MNNSNDPNNPNKYRNHDSSGFFSGWFYITFILGLIVEAYFITGILGVIIKGLFPR